MYDLPNLNIPKPKKDWPQCCKSKMLWFAVLIIFASSFFGFAAGISGVYLYPRVKDYLKKLNIELPSITRETPSAGNVYTPQTSQEEAIINAVKGVSPAVVSIVISKDVPVLEEYYYNPFGDFGNLFGGPIPDVQIPQYRQNGTQKQEIGGGTGVIVSSDGLVLTNKHVVADTAAEYTVLTNDGKKFTAKVLARDPVQDVAIIKIEQEISTGGQGEAVLKPFPIAKLGDSDNLQIGQTVIAIGNALGEFRNTVSVGVISGLGRTISASDSGGGETEILEDIIQTDAAINKGNSGGPLVNLKGEVIGINAAMAETAQSIGFTIPINKAKRDITQVQKSGKIIYPFLGVRYILVNEKVKEANKLAVDYGALISGNGQAAITPGSAADKAGLKEKDVILEINNEKITSDNSLAKVLLKYLPGDKVILKILRGTQEGNFEVVLGERS